MQARRRRRRGRKGENRRWAQQRGSFQLQQVVRQAFCCNVKPHLELHQHGAGRWEHVGRVTWPSATAPFYCHTVRAMAFPSKAGIPCRLTGSVQLPGESH